MANYEDLLRYRPRRGWRGVVAGAGELAGKLGATMRDKEYVSPYAEEEKSARDLIQKLELEEIKAERKRQEKEEERDWKERFETYKAELKREYAIPKTPKPPIITEYAERPEVMGMPPAIEKVGMPGPEGMGIPARRRVPAVTGLPEWKPEKPPKELGAVDYKRVYSLAEDMARGALGLTTFESVPQEEIQKYIPVARRFLEEGRLPEGKTPVAQRFDEFIGEGLSEDEAYQRLITEGY